MYGGGSGGGSSGCSGGCSVVGVSCSGSYVKWQEEEEVEEDAAKCGSVAIGYERM